MAELFTIKNYTPRQINESKDIICDWEEGTLNVISEENNLPEPSAELKDGKIMFVWSPRCLGQLYGEIVVYPANVSIDEAEVKKLDLKAGFHKVASKTWGIAKWGTSSLAAIIAIGIFIEGTSMGGWALPAKIWNMVPTVSWVRDSVKDETKPKSISQYVNSHKFFETEDGSGLDKIFWNAGNNLLVMKKTIRAKNKKGDIKPVSLDFDSADSYCSRYPDGRIGTYKELQGAFKQKKSRVFLRRTKFEWTSEFDGIAFGDYLIFGTNDVIKTWNKERKLILRDTPNSEVQDLKKNILISEKAPNGSYIEGSHLLLDEDYRARFRCVIQL